MVTIRETRYICNTKKLYMQPFVNSARENGIFSVNWRVLDLFIFCFCKSINKKRYVNVKQNEIIT